MPTRSQKYRLGLFIIVSLSALLLLLMIIGSEKFLKKRDIYLITYKDISVSGLEVGGPVKYLGLGVGTIKNIQIDPEDISRIIVTVALKPGTPIKKDTYADIELIGITGLKMIEIRGGSNEAELLEPEQFIQAGGSVTEAITGKAEIIAEKIELLLNNLNRFSQPENMDKITKLTESATQTFDNFDKVLVENRKDIRLIINQSQASIARIDTISGLLLTSVEKIHDLAVGDTLEEILSNVQGITVKLRKANLGLLIEQLSSAIEKTNHVLTLIDHDLESGSKSFFTSLERLKSTLEYLDEASRIINEDPSVLIRGTEFEDLPDEELDR
jgi:ABC-type transporter Mla subunit MlaD